MISCDTVVKRGQSQSILVLYDPKTSNCALPLHEAGYYSNAGHSFVCLSHFVVSALMFVFLCIF